MASSRKISYASFEPGTSLLAALLYFSLTMMSHATITAEPFGRAAGQSVELFTLRAPSGIEARIMTYGAALVSLRTRDRSGKLGNIILGFDSLAPYLAGVPYFGATVGRYANRIARGQFQLDGKNYQLSLNDGPNSLHGGEQGFDKRVWQVEARSSSPAGPTLRLKLVSPDGDQGYPGELTVHATYRLEGSSLSIEYEATTTAATPVNLANHAYFNLSGDPGRTILRESLQILAAQFTPVGPSLIPTGERRVVDGTPFDFRTPRAVGERIEAQDAQLKAGHGYDHNWILSGTSGELRPAANLYDPDSGRSLAVETTQPGLQFYSGNFLDGGATGASTFKHRTGLCLETQHFPDSPNQPAFPNTILREGEIFRAKTVLHFGVGRAR